MTILVSPLPDMPIAPIFPNFHRSWRQSEGFHYQDPGLGCFLLRRSTQEEMKDIRTCKSDTEKEQVEERNK